MNRSRTDYFHMEKPGSWLGRRSLTTETSRTQDQLRTEALLSSEASVSLMSAFYHLREEVIVRPAVQISESRPEGGTDRGNLAIRPMSVSPLEGSVSRTMSPAP